MKLLVIQEQHFTQIPNGEVWVDKQSDIYFWDRYLKVFDEIIVCARMKKSDETGAKALRSDRKEVTFIGMPDFRGARGVIKYYFAIQKALSAALEMADCIIFRAPSPISMVSYSIVKKSKKPFAVELMNNPQTHFSAQSMHHVYQPIIQRFITNQTKRMCRTANGVSYVTENVLQQLYPSTARIYGQNRDNYFEGSYSTIDLYKNNYKKKNWSTNRPDPVVFIHVGEMHDYRKGQDVFIKVIAELKRQGYSVQGILVGDGEIRSEFENLAYKLGVMPELEFVGWKSGFENVQTELTKGHILVFPSTGEGLPRVIIEAMASGLLCFGSKIDGICELLFDELLVDKLDAKAFVNCIKPFIENWGMALQYRDELFEKSKKYEKSKLESKRTDFYEKLKNCVLTLPKYGESKIY